MTNDVVMGSSISGVVAIMYMYMFYFEEMFLKQESHMSADIVFSDVWFRCIDDVLARFKGTKEDAAQFLQYLNCHRQVI